MSTINTDRSLREAAHAAVDALLDACCAYYEGLSTSADDDTMNTLYKSYFNARCAQADAIEAAVESDRVRFRR